MEADPAHRKSGKEQATEFRIAGRRIV